MIEETMVQMLSSMPRVTKEIEQVNAAAMDLKQMMAAIDAQLQKNKAQGGDLDVASEVVKTLSTLTVAKAKMEQCCSTLVEAARWNQLVQEVNKKFASSNLFAVAKEMTTLKSSEQILRTMPDAEQRASLLKLMEERLEVMVRPKLQDALQRDNVSALKEYVVMFADLGRLEVMVTEYALVRQFDIQKLWFEYSNEQFKMWLRLVN
jgi:hypothetical protein